MADADVAITAGAGTKIDTRTVGAGTDEHRQVVVIGDPTTAASVANVSTPSADANAATIGMAVNTQNEIFNGSTWDRVRTVEGFDTEAANPDTGLLAAWQPNLRFASLSLGTVIGNTQSWNTNGASSAMVRAGTSTTGTYIFEVSSDGTNYRSAEVRDAAADNWASGLNLTPTSGNNYRILTAGERLMRVRTVATLGATVAFIVNLTQPMVIIPAIKTGPAPHDFGYSGTGISATYSTAQTSVTIGPTITATQRMIVTYVQLQCGGTTAGTVQIYFGTGAFSRGTSKPIFDGEFAPSATSKPGFAQTFPMNAPEGALDEELKITSSAAMTLTVTIWYYLVGV